MKETIVTINKTKNWFFERIKIDKSLTRLIQKKRLKIKSTKSEMINERLLETMQRYKGVKGTITNNYMAIKWKTFKKWTDV